MPGTHPRAGFFMPSNPDKPKLVQKKREHRMKNSGADELKGSLRAYASSYFLNALRRLHFIQSSAFHVVNETADSNL